MKFSLATAALIGAGLLAGCAGTTIAVRSTNSPSIGGAPPPGSSSSSGSVAIQADVTPGAFIGLLLLGYLAAGAHDDYLGWRDSRAGRDSPQLDQDRAITERDCSRPMQQPSANLRCK
jgi:hypothetical protein